MRINTNVSAIVSNNALQKAQDALSSSIQRLSSGYKINSSADDPAGCAISEKMRVQIRGLDQAKNNTTDGISVINTAEGAIVEIQSMLTRLKEQFRRLTMLTLMMSVKLSSRRLIMLIRK